LKANLFGKKNVFWRQNKMKYQIFVISICLIFLTQSAYSQTSSLPSDAEKDIVSKCDYCGCSQGISPLETGSTGIRYDFRSLSLGAQYHGSEKQKNPLAEGESFITNQFTFFYHLSRELPITFSLSLPYVYRLSTEAEESGAVTSTKSSGIGDIQIFGRYHLHDYAGEATIGLSFGAGVKLPTGQTNVAQNGVLIDPDLRPGTGSTDFLLSLSGLWSMYEIGISGNLDGSIITGRGAKMDDGSYHKYGNWINCDITARYRLAPADVSESNLYLLLGLGAEFRGHETLDNKKIAASGGSAVYLAPGLRYIISMAIAADASIQLPLYQNLGFDPSNPDESQRGQKFRIIAGVQYHL
jgi:hypothetical protein